MRRIVPFTLVALAAASAAAQDQPAAPAAPKEEPPAAKAPEEKWEKTASGLEYQVLAPGRDGPKPRTGDQVKVSYKGWLESGKVFDESARHGGPATFPVGGLIPGWNEALTLMNVGAKWKLRIPSELGYGAQGAGPDIPPNSTLYFELELHEVIAMPVFTKPNPEAQKTTQSGLKYEVVKEGKGDLATADDMFELKYALFTSGGKLLECSERSKTIRARTRDMRLPFLKEAPLLLRAGSRYRFEVPPALAFGERQNGPDLPPNSVTIWELELVQIVKPLALPPFEAVDESKFTKTPSGLQVQVVREGSGTSPKLGQTVRVHYAGWLTDGTPFDSSFERGEPAEFQLGQVIEGWNEGLQQIKPGGCCRLVIPAKLAYGDRAVGDKIKPGSTLVFYVELLEVK
jgi:FKBP-type peptidyl-prolyl cis-trans isomerase